MKQAKWNVDLARAGPYRRVERLPRSRLAEYRLVRRVLPIAHLYGALGHDFAAAILHVLTRSLQLRRGEHIGYAHHILKSKRRYVLD